MAPKLNQGEPSSLSDTDRWPGLQPLPDSPADPNGREKQGGAQT